MSLLYYLPDPCLLLPLLCLLSVLCGRESSPRLWEWYEGSIKGRPSFSATVVGGWWWWW
jgi:hypothetical protein